ncbi:transmembrane emp24 domain-containing protein 7-like [Limulus polyphemus]|uniref:Transmembrane emp24 domain-containing protein 7-like n=1 Tax=Limulus polyphemus TaxID=6850 RepID=A0ABM1BFU3_LIMPO|nr:transmembrane emp24 domain-containing protein 7-like [Limulus polyphemus]
MGSILYLNQIFYLCCFFQFTEVMHSVGAVELTFELPDNAKQCFHEEITKDTLSTVEFQVVTGGQYDVDMSLESPTRQILYKGIKKQFDSFTWTAAQTGVYTVCFSNEFSTFSHKLVYMDFQVGDEKPLPGVGEHLSAMTKMESSSIQVHENLNTIIDYQTHHRLREAQGRKFAEDLNAKVFYWSIGEALAILCIGIGQVIILKNLFTDKKTVSFT